MSDHTVDRTTYEKVGSFLTQAFVKKGIRNISTVFVDELVALETKLPWRVEMAIQRLTKDLHVLPMFKHNDDASFAKMKQDIVADIVRPLKQPALLNDLLVNCYIIARNVEDMKAEDIEKIIVDSFPFEMLLPTVEFTFKEFDRLNQARDKSPDSKVLSGRILGIKRILRMIASRLITQETRESQRFLRVLYEKNLLSFEDLPPDAQYYLKTRRIIADIKEHSRSYIEGIENAQTVNEATVYIKCFRRSAAELVNEAQWPLLLEIAQAVKKITADAALFPPDERLPVLADGEKTVVEDETAEVLFENATDPTTRAELFIFKDVASPLQSAYGKMIDGPDWLGEKRRQLEELILILGPLGVEIISRILHEEENNAVRKAAMDLLLERKEMARSWSLLHLVGKEDSSRKLITGALYMIGHSGEGESDGSHVRPFLENEAPDLRKAALDAIARLQPPDMENLLITALTDEDKTVQRQAVRLLGQMAAPLSESGVNLILDQLTAEAVEGSDAKRHFEKMERLISALSQMEQVPCQERVESAVIALCRELEKQTSVWKRLIGRKKTPHTPLVEAAIYLLGRIGGRSSEDYLEALVRANSPYAESALATLEKLVKRNA